MDTPLRGLDFDVSENKAYSVWAAQCEDDAVLPFQAFKVQRPPLKNLNGTRSPAKYEKRTTWLVHQACEYSGKT